MIIGRGIIKKKHNKTCCTFLRGKYLQEFLDQISPYNPMDFRKIIVRDPHARQHKNGNDSLIRNTHESFFLLVQWKKSNGEISRRIYFMILH